MSSLPDPGREIPERPDQEWQKPRPAPGMLDPKALRETGEIVVIEDTPEDVRGREVEARQVEGTIEQRLRDNAAAALEVQAELIDRAARTSDADLPTTLRAVSDVSAKNIDGLYKVTGRDRPQQEGMVDMLSAMASKGYLKLNIELEAGEPAAEDPPPDELDP